MDRLLQLLRSRAPGIEVMAEVLLTTFTRAMNAGGSGRIEMDVELSRGGSIFSLMAVIIKTCSWFRSLCFSLKLLVLGIRGRDHMIMI